ncbi:BamA/TamA family outer membrane protein [bacterium SCSIO 12741]|nr:BamA/TamA family outer membrane protein [bacterium SCSIO 12741]
MKQGLLIILFLLSLTFSGFAQIEIGGNAVDYTEPKEYRIGGVTVSGAKKLDASALVMISGLKVGRRITVPGDEISKAVKKLWKQGLFEDVKVSYTRIQGENIFLDIYIKEQPRLSYFEFEGSARKSEVNDIRDDIELYREKIVTENLIQTTREKVKSYYIQKGFLNADVRIEQRVDPKLDDHVILTVYIEKEKKVKINSITISDNKNMTSYVLKRAMKETREKSNFEPFYDLEGMIIDASSSTVSSKDSTNAGRIMWDYATDNIHLNIFKSSKFIESNYDADKKAIIERYKSYGYRDAKIVKDSIYPHDEKTINIELAIDEGPQYFIRNIKWIGNTKFNTYRLRSILGIWKGDIYNPNLLEQRLFMDPMGQDISSLYMDEGYLFFQVTPVEVYVENDSVDIEIRMYEGQQARINKVYVAGNTKTNDHVIYREIRTYPGNLFSRSDIMRSQRELSVLGFFDPQAMNVTPMPNPENGTVDIEYTVAEKPSDQIELSGGFGGGRIVGSAGISFTNFSLRNLLNFKEWRPLPSGDGQKLSIRGQTSGRWFSSINMSFTEPWLGGKKPISFTFSGYYSVQTNGERRRIENDRGQKIDNPARRHINIAGVSVGLGKQLKWPDDYFILRHEFSYQNYEMKDWNAFIFDNGFSNNLFYKVTLNRNSLGGGNGIVYPTHGSDIKVSMQLTPPYSAFNNKDYTALEDQEKYRWIEYYKWKVTCDWYTPIIPKQNLVLKAKVGFGFLGYYNGDIGPAPFERFYLGVVV